VTWSDVTWPQATGSDPEEKSFHRSHLEVAVGGRKLAYSVHFTSYKAVALKRRQNALQEMTSHDLRWPKVTWKWRHLTGSHFEVAVEGRKLAYTAHFTSHKPVARRRRQSRDMKWCHMTSGDCKWPKVTLFDRKSPGSGCRRPKTCVSCTFHLLQACSSQEKAVTWQEMTSRDLRWPEVTRKWRDLAGSHLEVAVEARKLSYPVRFTSYKPVARRRRQSRDRKWCHVISGDWKWPRIDVIWPEVTWK